MIELAQVSRSFGARPVVTDVSLRVATGAILTVVGTSGSGKTTLLRMINRLVEPSTGTIRVAGRDVRSVAPHVLRRGIGYAIQGHGLFPHRTVAENIGTVPHLLGWDRRRIAARVDELLGLFRLDPALYRDRLPGALSGGEQQRIGVARALAAEPPILLMDEPFGALDPIIRGRAQEDLLAIQRRYGTTIVLVTHDMDEALRLGDRIAVMDAGRLVQEASPAALIGAPATDFVRLLLGGRDRAFQLMALRVVDELVEPGAAPGEPIPVGTSVRAALAESLWSRRAALPVSRDGVILGRVTRAALEAEGAEP
ncbi:MULTISPECIES: ABC transporter ATP-binding protein [Methylobacterium]|jgi:osmoprotectant transport system ATP-binding protein|uniref:ABC transporter ATP-binding protein n=1 Tax=Methylobacterium longum TaxID=767694 RepID=A0ABT8AYS2_9HYPH|nr:MULTISPECIES: ABC transporter ATP-binding protein [Methylobacterium]MCJ2099338.1 ABC transporter ATP-binding protein [Methylobacterium sp. E-046]MDN3574705.1 ABC transporter ATP-binding protein [Methylobacterium longum]GJE13157.1 Glycine betaine uptake system ATP-binding protein YehX [Methylobacterium longum]